jgi:hypothetical protein
MRTLTPNTGLQPTSGALAVAARFPATAARSSWLRPESLCALTRTTAANPYDHLLRLKSRRRRRFACGYKATDVEGHRRVTR